MDSIFGLSMNVLLVVMLTLLGISLSFVVYIALRNRIMFLIGVRNIPRRMAQTVLIIVGLMLSTLIISAAFTTGDTVDRSLTNQIFRLLGHVDEIVRFESRDDTPAPNVAISVADFETLEDEVRGDPNIDGLVPMMLEVVAVIEPERRQSAPRAGFAGLDETRLDAFPDLEDAEGNPLDLASLGEEEVRADEGLADELGVTPGTFVTVHGVFVNESLADELDTTAGALIIVYHQNRPIPLRVAAVTPDRVITGALDLFRNEGLVTGLETLQALLDRPGEADLILVSNTGGARDGVDRSDAVVARLEEAFEARGLQLAVSPEKLDGLEHAERDGAGLLTFFLVFGIFSVAAGVLLIVMIFVMLAAERKSELGMARALGTKRWHLMEIFVAEGMGYNLVSALVGAGLGVLVAFALTGILASIFSGADFDIGIEPYVSPRSFAIAYSIGVVLTFATVTFSSWRVSQLNIVRAIRDLPEPPAKPGWRSAAVGLGLAPLAGLLMLAGFAADRAFFFALGFSFACFAAAILSRLVRLPERLAFTTIGLTLLGFWVMFAGDRVPGVAELEGGPEMFILSGIVMVAAASFVLVYNADLLLAVVSFTGGRMGRLLPALRMAVAYPLDSKFRTGMTLAMISLVVFALTMMSVMNDNFSRLFLNEENIGSWDVGVLENRSNPLSGGLTEALAASDLNVDTSGFAAVGSLGLARLFGAELCQPDASACGDEDFGLYLVKGADSEFLLNTELPLQARAQGYETDRAVWDAIAADPNLAVIDASALGGGGIGFDGEIDLFALDGLEEDVTAFDSVPLEVRDSVGGGRETVRVIGILGFAAVGAGDIFSGAGFFGLITGRELVVNVFGEVELTSYYVHLEDPERAEGVAREIEAALLTTGAQASSLLKDREDTSRLFTSFFYLMQAFAGLGLVVGIAAVGVVAFRSVVERRQQIGMLRAIGFSRGMVALSFMIESSFIALLGVLSGIGLAILLASFLLTSDEFSTLGITSVHIPWLRISLVGLFALGATLLMTFIPSRQAASVPIAEALRYE